MTVHVGQGAMKGEAVVGEVEPCEGEGCCVEGWLVGGEMADMFMLFNVEKELGEMEVGHGGDDAPSFKQKTTECNPRCTGHIFGDEAVAKVINITNVLFDRFQGMNGL